jgi:ATP-dependent protease HslVU (ClpYQ) peptidase subunit
MTLIVGIRCRDGIAVGADSAATLGSGGVMTITQPTQKIEIIDGTVIVACSGSVGMAQRIAQRISTLWRDKQLTGDKCRTAVDAGVTISNEIRHDIIAEATVAQQVGNVLPSARAFATSAIVAMPIAKQLALIEFSETGAPEVVPNTVPFVSIGSGKPLADPFLGFLRRIFWPDTEPSLAEGSLAAVWTIDQCIRTSFAFLAQPVHIAELRKESGGGFSAHRLSLPELLEHRQQIDSAEAALNGYKSAKVPVEAPPEPPPTDNR